MRMQRSSHPSPVGSMSFGIVCAGAMLLAQACTQDGAPTRVTAPSEDVAPGGIPGAVLSGSSSGMASSLSVVCRATAKYHALSAALADGYQLGCRGVVTGCIELPGVGARNLASPHGLAPSRGGAESAGVRADGSRPGGESRRSGAARRLRGRPGETMAAGGRGAHSHRSAGPAGFPGGRLRRGLVRGGPAQTGDLRAPGPGRDVGIRRTPGAPPRPRHGRRRRGGGSGIVAGASRWLAPLLFETSVVGPLVAASLCALPVTSAVVACVLPAAEAARVDP